jgi:hypothetical protein
MEVFTLNNDAENSIRGMLSSIQNNVEFEIRLGKYIYNKETKKVSFESNVEVQFFYRLRSILKQKGLNYKYTNTEELIFQNFDSKGVTKKITSLDTNTITYQYKNTFKKYDIREFDFRVTLASEKQVYNTGLNENTQPSIIRRKSRMSFLIDIGQIDLTIVQEFDSQGSFLQTKYEVEIEVSSPNVPYEKLKSLLSIILQTRQENFFVIPSSERRNVFNEYKNLVGASYFIGAQAETLQKENINVLYKELYSVTDKADGDRYFLFIDSNGLVYMLDSNICSMLKTNLVCKEFASTLIDGELVKHSTYISFHAFDILFYKKQDLREDNNYLLPKRLELLEKVMEGIPKNPIYIFVMKRFIFRNVFIGSEIIMSSIEENEYKNDGLIFTPMNEPYPKKKKWSKLLKWKPSEQNSIDFYAIKKESKNGIGKWELYVQHVIIDETKSNNTNNSNQISTQLALFDIEKLCGAPQTVETFTTTFDESLIDTTTGDQYQSNTVIEFSWDQEMRKFIPMRTRWDKTINPKKHGNFSSVALSIWNTIHNPISLEFLSRFSNVPTNNFFFDQMRRYHNKVKEYLYNTYCKKANSILELCSGRGGDLHKWMFNGIQNVTGYDINQKSIDECYKRLGEIDRTKKYQNNYKFYQLDLNSEHAGTLVHTNAEGVLYNSIVCQFGFHYFCESEESIRKMLSMVDENLEENGQFILTFMDNTNLNTLFANKDMIYTMGEQNDIVFFLKRQMNETPFGNKLKIYLNGNNVLSDSSYEFIIDFNTLCKITEEYNFKLVDTKLFQEMSEKIPMEMDEYEREISYLNRYCIFQKTSNKEVSNVQLKNETTIEITKNVIEKEYKLIDIENQNIQLHKIETFYDIIDTLNCVEYTYNKLNYNDKQIERFEDIQQLFEELKYKYPISFLNKKHLEDFQKTIVFYYNLYTVEKTNKSINNGNENNINENNINENSNIYKNWYIVLFSNKIIVNSDVCKSIHLEENISNSTDSIFQQEPQEQVQQQTQVQVQQVQQQQQEQQQPQQQEQQVQQVQENQQQELQVQQEIDYKLYTVKQLQEKLKELGLKSSGKKAELIERLKQN